MRKTVLWMCVGLLVICGLFGCPQQETPQEEMVYIAREGESYHKQDCGHIKNSIRMAIVLTEARKGLDPCKDCHPSK